MQPLKLRMYVSDFKNRRFSAERFSPERGIFCNEGLRVVTQNPDKCDNSKKCKTLFRFLNLLISVFVSSNSRLLCLRNLIVLEDKCTQCNMAYLLEGTIIFSNIRPTEQKERNNAKCFLLL